MAPETESAEKKGERFQGRPRMVFFRITDAAALPGFINWQFAEQVKCLEQFFEVVVIGTNADYDEVVGRVQPDVALFESGVYGRAGRSIVHTHRHPQIPKIGFLHSDAFCVTRSVFLADMEDWGVDTFFAHAASAVGYTFDIADRTYAWPNFADRSMFHSYPGGKTDTFLLTGSRETDYPWRIRIDRLLRDRFDVRTIAHAGWFKPKAAASMPVGEPYARALSASLIVPTCGTIAQEFVRKYAEIPAAGAVLLAERTAAAEAAGFVDMENCVFADASDVVDKVEHLLENPDILSHIARKGQELAHARHSIEHRDQLRQWYELYRRKGPGERIVQPDLFGPLTLEPATGPASAVSVAVPPGVDRILIEQGRRWLALQRPVVAADCFAQVLNFRYEPEAALGLVRSMLRLGRVAWVRRVLDDATGLVLSHGASHPDPVEWAWMVRGALCDGDFATARVLAARRTTIRHPELDRIRAVVSLLAGQQVSLVDRPRHLSVHTTGETDSWETWVEDLVRDLRACGRDETARRVQGLGDPLCESTPTDAPSTRRRAMAAWSLRLATATFEARRFANRATRRLRRLWTQLRGPRPEPARSSIAQLFGGRPIEVAVLVLTDEDIARRVEDCVVRTPSAVGLVRIGRADTSPLGQQFTTQGMRWGVNGPILRQIPAWGRALAVASEIGAALLEVEHLANAEALVVLGGVETDIERNLATDPNWRLADGDVKTRLAGVLNAPDLRLWEHIEARATGQGSTR